MLKPNIQRCPKGVTRFRKCGGIGKLIKPYTMKCKKCRGHWQFCWTWDRKLPYDKED